MQARQQHRAAIVIVILLSLVLAACGDDSTPTRQDKDLAKDRLLFSSNQDGWPDLYTLDQTGKITGRLTESAEAEWGAIWSPDGKKIAYTALNGDQAAGDYAQNRKVVVMDADGKNSRVVATDGFSPQWSPDGSKLLYLKTSPDNSAQPTATPDVTPTPLFGRFFRPVTSSANNDQKLKSALYVASIDSGTAPANPVLDNAVYGVWSPDGKRIAYIAGSNQLDKPRTLHLANADGTNDVNLSERAKLTELDIVYVSWSPDGSNLAFSGVDLQRDKASVYKLSPEGNTARRLSDYQGSGRELLSLIWAYADYYNPAPKIKIAPVWSPNSRLVAFADASPRLVVSEADTGNSKIYPVGSAALGQDKDSVLSVSWLPDSRRLVYNRAGVGRNGMLTQANYYAFDWVDDTLEVLDTVNKNITALASPNGSHLLPACCGTDLLGAGQPDATPVAGPSPTTRPQTTLPAIANATPGGKLITVGGVGYRNITVFDLATNQRTVITNGPFRDLDFTVSPGYDRLVYIEVGDQYNSTLYASGLDGKQRRKLSEGTGEPDDLSMAVRWSPDGRQVAFQALGNDPNLKPGLYVLGLDPAENENQTPRLITSENVAGFDWGPDGNTLVYRVDDTRFNLFLVDVNSPQNSKRLLTSVGLVNRNYSSLGKGLLWSPDGKYIAVSGPSTYARYATWLVTMDGKTKEVPSSVVSRLSGWSSDSQRLIAATANFNQTSDVQVLNVATGSWRSYGPGSGPQVDSTGQYIAVYSRYEPSRFSNSGGTALQRMTIIQLSNGGQQDLELNYPPYFAFRARFFDWSPDSKILAYYENNTIWGVGPDAKQPKPIGRAIGVERLVWAGKPK